MIKKCPVCNSTKFKNNLFEKGTKKCLKCGYELRGKNE